MTKPHKVFRYLWRVNAILILVAAGAVTFGVAFMLVSTVLDRVATQRQVEPAPAVIEPGSCRGRDTSHASAIASQPRRQRLWQQRLR